MHDDVRTLSERISGRLEVRAPALLTGVCKGRANCHQRVGAGKPVCGDVCPSGQARCDDGLGDYYIAMQGCRGGADRSGLVELRLVEVVGLLI